MQASRAFSAPLRNSAQNQAVGSTQCWWAYAGNTGPYHVALKSTSTGRGEFWIMSSKLRKACFWAAKVASGPRAGRGLSGRAHRRGARARNARELGRACSEWARQAGWTLQRSVAGCMAPSKENPGCRLGFRLQTQIGRNLTLPAPPKQRRYVSNERATGMAFQILQTISHCVCVLSQLSSIWSAR